MNFNPTIGKIYDTIFFLTEYFNPDLIEREYEPLYMDVSMMKQCYQEVKEMVGEIPPILAPFFTYSSDVPVFISHYFIKHVDWDISDLSVFIYGIRSNIPEFLDIYLTYFKEYSPYIALSTNQTAELFGKFEHYISELCNLLEQVYKVVALTHFKYFSYIDGEYTKSCSQQYRQIYISKFNLTDAILDNATFSYSLLNPVMVYEKTVESSAKILLGINNREQLSIDYDTASAADNFLCVCTGEIRVKLLRALIKYKELTASQIAKEINCPPTTLIRPISLLLDHKIIYISRRTGIQIYYSLNIPYLRRIHYDLNKMFTEIFKQETSK